MWGTDDDVVGAASKVELSGPYDPFHYPDRAFFVSAAGPDGMWGGADDIVSSLRTFECTDGVSIKDYDDPGPDGRWGSADDVLSSQQTLRMIGPSCGHDPCVAPVPFI